MPDIKPYRKTAILVLILLLGLGQKSWSQDPYFSQYFLNPVYMNPAYCGTMHVPRIGTQYRNQWPALSKAYTTYFASFDTYLPKYSSGIGLLMFQDVQASGIFTQSSFKIIYSREIQLNRMWKMAGSISAGAQLNALNFNRLVFADGLDVIHGQYLPTGEKLPEDNHRIFPDFGAGLLAFNNKYFFGLACDHLGQPDQSMYPDFVRPLARKYTVHFEVNLPYHLTGHLRKFCTFNPDLIVQSQGGEQTLTWGLYANRRSFTLGLWNRQTFKKGSDIIALASYIGKQFKTAISYDVNLHGSSLRSQGAFEVSICFLLKDPGPKSVFPFYEIPGEWEIR